MTKKSLLTCALLATALPTGANAGEPELGFTKLWTHAHTTPGQVSEIPAFDPLGNTLWIAGVEGVDVLDAETGELVHHIDVTSYGKVNSVAIHDGLAAFAIEASPDRRDPGIVLFYDTLTLAPLAGTDPVTVGALPDMLSFTPDGSRLLVANEATPNAVVDAPYTPANDPAGSVSIIDVATHSLIANAGFAGVPTSGEHLRTNAGMDFEPEYIAIDADGTRAWVTLQEANAIATLDLLSNSFTRVFGLGAKDFNLVANAIDPKDNNAVAFVPVAAKGLYMPDTVAAYQWKGRSYTVLANEGDFREDNADRVAAGSAPFNAASPLDRLRIVRTESAHGDLYAAGARSFSIRDEQGKLVYDSGSILDREANARGIYDDGRSRDKGVEPEGVALLKIKGRTYAFIGLERTTQAAVAVFDVSVPASSFFVDMIVTPGDLAPEGLAAFKHEGRYYLAIANETVAPGETSSHTTLYRIDSDRSNAE